MFVVVRNKATSFKKKLFLRIFLGSSGEVLVPGSLTVVVVVVVVSFISASSNR